jgi:hypothetical protein
VQEEDAQHFFMSTELNYRFNSGVERARGRGVSRLNGKLFESWKRDVINTTSASPFGDGWGTISYRTSYETRDETARPWSRLSSLVFCSMCGRGCSL